MPVIVGGTNDGYCASGLGNWSTARTHAGASFDSNNSYDTYAVSSLHFVRRGTYTTRRAFFEFDTSGISVTPSAATLKIQGITNNAADVIAVRSEQGATLAAGDFDSFESAIIQQFLFTDGNGAGTLAGVADVTYSAEIATWNTSGTYNDIALNAKALADMVTLSLFKVCLMEYDHDYLDIDGGGSSVNCIGLRWAENGDTKWPYIDYTAGAAVTDNATFFGANF